MNRLRNGKSVPAASAQPGQQSRPLYGLLDPPCWSMPLKAWYHTVEIGAGSGGCRVLAHKLDRIVREAGGAPGFISFVGFDAAQQPACLEAQHFKRIGDGREDGAGCDPARLLGLHSLVSAQVEEQLAARLSAMREAKLRPCPLNIEPPSEPMDSTVMFNITATCGGTGTALVELLPNQILKAARDAGIEHARICLNLIGPSITTQASDRAVDPIKRDQIQANHSRTIETVYGWLAQYREAASERAFSVTLYDRKNEVDATFGPMHEFERHMAECGVVRAFTSVGKFLMDFFADHRELKQYHGSASGTQRGMSEWLNIVHLTPTNGAPK